MPIHDWSKVRAGIFHHFHQDWTIEIARTLNRGLLPPMYYALAEQVAIGQIPDVLTLEQTTGPSVPRGEDGPGGLAVATTPPRARIVRQAESEEYAAKANRIVIHHNLGYVVAVLENDTIRFRRIEYQARHGAASCHPSHHQWKAASQRKLLSISRQERREARSRSSSEPSGIAARFHARDTRREGQAG